MIPSEPAARHRVVAGTFGERVAGTTDWSAPAPVEGWVAGDVVRHLVDWLPALLATGGVELTPEPLRPEQDDDLPAAWATHAAAVQALLDDPVAAARPFSHPHIPLMPLAAAIDRFYTVDVFMHTWDLSRATGQPSTLDAQLCTELREGMAPIEEMLRSSGQYGPAVPVAEGADPTERLIGFIGRDPYWSPGGSTFD